MAGGTPAHADLAAAAVRSLGNALGDRCRVSTSDLKVRVEATTFLHSRTSPLSCGERLVSTIDKNAVVNPTLLVEVTSTSTEDYDRGEKLNHYKQCPSLRAVIFLSHRRAQVTVVMRAGLGWEEREYRSGDVLRLEQPELNLSVDELYVGIELEGG